MDGMMITSVIILLACIVLVITGIIDTVIAAFLGVFGMIVFGVMTDLQAFKVVDWNVIFLIMGMMIFMAILAETNASPFYRL